MRLYIYIILSFLLCTSNYAARNSQVNGFLGQDTPDTGEERTGSATLFKFSLTTKPSILRFVTSFTGAVGSGFTQGELGFGVQMYPLAFKNKSYVQPLVYIEGVFGVGSLNDKSRTDAGYDLGAGLDIRMGKISGLNISVSIHNATESSTRLWLGWFTMI